MEKKKRIKMAVKKIKAIEKKRKVATDYLETNIDRLFHLVEEKKNLKVSDAAKRFNIPEDKIEEWGQVLEEHNLIELHYPTIGKPVLRSLSLKKKVSEKK